MSYTLRNYQHDVQDFILENRRVMILASMGLGKTLCVLSSMRMDSRLLPALVVAPKRVCRFVWPTEITKFGFNFVPYQITGSKSGHVLNSPADLILCNPENLKVVLDHCKKTRKIPYGSVVVDESTRFKNPMTKGWKMLRAIIDAVPNRILMTGTPVPNSYADLWGQVDLLGDNPLGSYRSFLDLHFTFDMFGRPSLKRGHDRIIESLVAPKVIRKDIDDELDLPPLTEADQYVSLPHEVLMKYDCADQMEESDYLGLRCIASGFEYEHDDDGTRQTRWLHEEKLRMLESIVAENQGHNILVAFNFRAERQAIVRRFVCPFIDGSTSSTSAEKSIQRWQAGELPMLAIHPRSAGHGLNLQNGGRTLVWYSLPDSSESYDQTVARLYRGGQKDSVIVHRILAKGTIDSVICDLVNRKKLNQANLLAAMTDRIVGKNAIL